MSEVYQTIDAAIEEAAAARKRVQKIRTRQVRGIDEIASLKATAQTWFHKRRPIIATEASNLNLETVDQCFTLVLNATDKHAAKSTYSNALKQALDALVAMRTDSLTAAPAGTVTNTDDIVPDFSPLVGNQEVRDVLTRRWNECAKCVNAGAHLAAIVMMGGLLEALFVARANKMTDKTPLVSAAHAPKDKITGRTINYQDWMLDSYIKVGHELNWITASAKDVADKLKEYRNFVHPAKELRHGVTFNFNDSSMFWQVTKALARQLLLSA